MHRGNSRTKPHKRTTDQLTFRIPFINNKIDNEIRRALDRHNIEARIVLPNREPFYSWRSRKWNLQNATQKPAQSNTLIARGPMWSTKSRVNCVGSATLDPLCVPSTTERENTSPLPKSNQGLGHGCSLQECTQELKVQPQTTLQDCLRHGERRAAVENRRGAGYSLQKTYSQPAW